MFEGDGTANSINDMNNLYQTNDLLNNEIEILNLKLDMKDHEIICAWSMVSELNKIIQALQKTNNLQDTLMRKLSAYNQ